MIDIELQKRILSSLILIPFSIFFIIKGSIFFILFLSFFLMITIYEWAKMDIKNNFIKTLGIFFIFFSFVSAFFIRENEGQEFLFLIILICIFTDLGGYIFGKIIKGPKLTSISPNKTYAGVLGGLIFPFIAGNLYILYSNFHIFENSNFKFTIFILLISLLSQIGDLVVSYFKRRAKIKDTGKIIPGHGGLLDRIDGLIFVIPIVYLINLI
tara:strand:- start:1 stop:636 length:636 start_codon:yes stop_codon:yes gene_type:complete